MSVPQVESSVRGQASSHTDGDKDRTGNDLPPAVELEGIWKFYGATPAVRDVHLTVNCGEVVGLVGDNGSGKSTLVKIIMGYHRPTRGRLRLFGEDVDSALARPSPVSRH